MNKHYSYSIHKVINGTGYVTTVELDYDDAVITCTDAQRLVHTVGKRCAVPATKLTEIASSTEYKQNQKDYRLTTRPVATKCYYKDSTGAIYAQKTFRNFLPLTGCWYRLK